MNIQIFGTKKCNDTKKAERFFKERGIKYQFIDMKEKGRPRGLILIGLPIVFSITYAYAKDKFNDASYFSAGWAATVGQ